MTATVLDAGSGAALIALNVITPLHHDEAVRYKRRI
jgi:hypothetical protein